MFTLSHTMPVNASGSPALARRHLWRGLVLKAENPVPFLEDMTACTVVERTENGLLRDFTLRGENMQERITFEPEKRVVFERTKSSAMGTIVNEIVEEDGLALRFSFSLQVDGIPHGSDEERAYAERMSRSYFKGVASTLAEIRRRLTAGELETT